ncbi:hypothetical protein [Ectopseudomonas toyotomiensis]|uniref:hypothetical protein n=1 Tax=Ectopseudomonas toyotomiensis TaxID=554344 RepID=UPI001113514C|nr:hypothetical protein [Pseudomonas toyotomiensis]
MKLKCTAGSLFVSLLLSVGVYAYAEGKTEVSDTRNNLKLQITGESSLLSIQDCDFSECKDVRLPASFLKSFNEGYSNIYIEDVTSDGHPEVILTGPEHGVVNICSKIYIYHGGGGELKEITGFKHQICNYRIKNGRLISSYRSEAKWHEDVYLVSGDKIALELSDSCIGCDEVNRTIYLPDGETEKMMVSSDADYTLRKPIFSKIIADRAALYGGPDASKKTKMYLIKNDSVALLDFRETESSTRYWYKVKYITNKGKEIKAWVICDSLEYCK